MDRRDFILHDRQHRLRAAIEAGKTRTPPGEKPPDAVIPRWDGNGGCVCPRCGGTCVTPVAWNPWLGLDERMILVAGKCNNCPHKACGARHYVTEELAQLHNSHLYPDDYRFWARKTKRRDG